MGMPAIRERLEQVHDVPYAVARRRPKNGGSAGTGSCSGRTKTPQRSSFERLSSNAGRTFRWGFVGAETVISNLANAIYGAEPWLLDCCSPACTWHWVSAVMVGWNRRDIALLPGARLRTLPGCTAKGGRQREESLRAGRSGFGPRAVSSGQTLAGSHHDPEDARRASRSPQPVDETVDRLYRRSGFASDEERRHSL